MRGSWNEEPPYLMSPCGDSRRPWASSASPYARANSKIPSSSAEIAAVTATMPIAHRTSTAGRAPRTHTRTSPVTA